MALKLIITEKPSVAKEIATALGGFMQSGCKRFLSNKNDCLITWAYGHLIELQHPIRQDIHSLPMLPQDDDWQLQVIKQDGYQEQFDNIVTLINHPNVEYVVNACDAGREGEFIGRLIFLKSGSTKPFKRMWINSMTKDALKRAYNNIEDASKYDGLGSAAFCRSKSDWIVGLNGSIATSAVMRKKYQIDQTTAIGRVKTPVLTMVVERQREIENFIPKSFFEIEATFNINDEKYSGKWVNPARLNSVPANLAAGNDDKDDLTSSMHRLTDKAQASDIVAAVKKHGVVDDVKDTEQEKSVSAPNLFDLTSLQVLANKVYKFSAKKTLDLTQELYEKHKMVTYPRTESGHLPNDYVEETRKMLGALAKSGNAEWMAHSEAALARVDVVGKAVFDDSKVTDHFAIIPTGVFEAITGDVRKVYDLIVKRTKQAFLPAMRYNQTERITTMGQYQFKSIGQVILDVGWKIMEKPESTSKKPKEADKTLPLIDMVENVGFESVKLHSGTTTPPKPYNNGTLILAMKQVSRKLEGEQKEALKACGIGTPATRATIIEELMSTHSSTGKVKQAMLMENAKKDVLPTEFGKQVVGFLQEIGIISLTTPAFTADWELQLSDVADNKQSGDAFMDYSQKIVADMVGKLQQTYDKLPVQYVKGTNCPDCNGALLVEPRYVKCENADCTFKVQRIIANRPLTDADLNVLITNKQTGPLDGFIKKPDPKDRKAKNKTFTASLKLERDQEQGWKVVFFFETKEFDAACPACQGELVDSGQTVKCADKGCGFIAWWVKAGLRLSKPQMQQVLSTGKSDEISGFKDRNGKVFKAMIVVDLVEKNTKFQFNNAGGTYEKQTFTKTKKKCVKKDCKGVYLDYPRCYKCTECSTFVNKEFKDAEPLNEAQLEALLNGDTIMHAVMVEDKVTNEKSPKMIEMYVCKKNGGLRRNYKVKEEATTQM